MNQIKATEINSQSMWSNRHTWRDQGVTNVVMIFGMACFVAAKHVRFFC